MSSDNVPQWKKDLIARLRSQNKRTGQQLFPQAVPPADAAPVHQPARSDSVTIERCESACPDMVQDRRWQPSDSESSAEDLHYGPGIVHRLRERYLSLAQRSTPPTLRKAASLEDLLDEPPTAPRLFQPRPNSVENRYRRGKRSPELKRARSVETISVEDHQDPKRDLILSPEDHKYPKRESLHEEVLIAATEAREGSDVVDRKPHENVAHKGYVQRVNRPKRIQPVMSEKEKPPLDVVKQAKMIFERRPEQRTRAPQQTGEVAAKVATYKSIIVQAKAAKKPVVKVKPVVAERKSNGVRRVEMKGKDKVEDGETKPTIPIRDKTPPEPPQNHTIKTKPEDADKTVVDAPIDIRIKTKPEDVVDKKTPPAPVSPKIKTKTEDLDALVDTRTKPQPEDTVEKKTPPIPVSLTIKTKKEDPVREKPSEIVPPPPKSPEKPPSLPSPIPDISRVDFKNNEESSRSLSETPDLIITSSPLPAVNSPSFRISATENFIKEEIQHSHPPEVPKKPESPSKDSRTCNFVKNNKASNHLPTVNKNVLNVQTPPSQPLKLEINGVSNGVGGDKGGKVQVSGVKAGLTTLEIEKNLINAAKTLKQPGKVAVSKVSVEEVTVRKVPKKKPPHEHENNSIVFDFTDREYVPNHVQNDGVRKAAKLEKPKVGEGGIILLRGASIDESFTEDEELLRSLEGPPSPCDVMFINDNILIDGKSSLNQKTKKAKMKISFVEEGPEIYEYPSESSLLIEDMPKSPPVSQLRNSVPSLSGSTSLANYTPKGTADFQPGVTRSVQAKPIKDEPDSEHMLQEVETPILFSAGANSDILF